MKMSFEELGRKVQEQNEMNEFIRSSLEPVHAAFLEDTRSQSTFCWLKEFTFGNGTPDYSNRVWQRFYLLRYFPAYLIEYYWFYRELLKTIDVKVPLNVLSIGSGWMIDYFALFYAARSLNRHQIRYTGLDRIDWHEIPCAFNEIPRDSIRLSLESWRPDPGQSFNVVSFPRSFEEMSLKLLSDTILLLTAVDRPPQTVSIVLMASCAGVEKQIPDKLKVIVEAMSKSGYQLTGTVRSGNRSGEMLRVNCAIKDIYPPFRYPAHIRDDMLQLYRRCSGYENHPQWAEEQCKKRISRFPKCTVADMYYRIMQFERCV